MNKKYLLFGGTILLATALVWAGRNLYRARLNLVSLDVYNAPLAEVVDEMARQTREAILFDKRLEVKVTLAVKNLPLDEALNRLAQQAGANWSKWHAVHGSKDALKKLEAALRDNAKIEAVGWTNLAPPNVPPDIRPGREMTWNTADHDQEAGGGAAVITKHKPVMIRLGPEDLKGGDMQAALREKLKAAGVDENILKQAGPVTRENSMDMDVDFAGGSNVTLNAGQPRPRIRMITRSSGPGGELVEEIWSSEHIVLDQRLVARLGSQEFEEPSETRAQEICGKVNGDLTTLYVLRKSPGGFPFGGRMARQIHLGTPGGTNFTSGAPPPLPDIEAAVKRTEAERYVRLTPEQRVQRAREKQTANAHH